MIVEKDKNCIWVSNLKETISYPDKGNSDSFDIEETSFWFKHRNKIIENVIKRIPFNGDFVDIGGGNGYQLMKIAELNKSNNNILIEPGYEGCLNAIKRNISQVYNVTVENFDFDRFNVTGVSMFDVLEHIEKDVDFIKQLIQKIQPGTKLYITVPSHNYLWSDADDYGGHFKRYNKKMVVDLARQTGTELVYFSYFFSYLYPFSFFLRALPYKLGKRMTNDQVFENESSQHNPKGLVKKVFDFFEKRELKRIESGIVKQGASCIFVLKK